MQRRAIAACWLVVKTNGRFLDTLNFGSHEIDVFRVREGNGRLKLLQTAPGLPETANGMAAH